MSGELGRMEMVEDGERKEKRGQCRVTSIYWLIMRRGCGD
jgi:hypothetical protein